jgi:hypothetical protein
VVAGPIHPVHLRHQFRVGAVGPGLIRGTMAAMSKQPDGADREIEALLRRRMSPLQYAQASEALRRYHRDGLLAARWAEPWRVVGRVRKRLLDRLHEILGP